MPLDAHGHGGDHHDWKQKGRTLDGHGGDDHTFGWSWWG